MYGISCRKFSFDLTSWQVMRVARDWRGHIAYMPFIIWSPCLYKCIYVRCAWDRHLLLLDHLSWQISEAVDLEYLRSGWASYLWRLPLFSVRIQPRIRTQRPGNNGAKPSWSSSGRWRYRCSPLSQRKWPRQEVRAFTDVDGL